MKMEQTECSETSTYKINTPEITQKKAYNIQNKAKVWILINFIEEFGAHFTENKLRWFG